MDLEAIHYLSILYSLLIFFCWCSNSLIVVATFRTQKLHRSCNILVAFCAFSDIIHAFGQLPKIIPVLFGEIEISSRTCCLLQIIPNFGLSSGVIIVLLIAIDRFIAVYFLKFYLVKDSRRYLICHSLAIFVYASMHYAFAYFFFEERNVMCSPPDMYQGLAKKLWGMTSLTVITLSVGIYYVVRRKLKHTESLSQDHRLFRSIFAVMCVIILGWLLSMFIFNFVRSGLNLQGRQFEIGLDISGIPVNTAVSLNSFVLYYTCIDYRRAFRQQLEVIPVIGLWFPPEKPLSLSTIFESTTKSSFRHSSITPEII